MSKESIDLLDGMDNDADYDAPGVTETKISMRELRKQVFVLLFLAGFHEKSEREEYTRRYLETLRFTPEIQERILDRYRLIAEKLSLIDPMISKSAEGWNLRRIGKVELNLMRIAVFEIYYDPDVDTAVAVNEAVRLGHEYGGDQAHAFINGILSAVMKNNPLEA